MQAMLIQRDCPSTQRPKTWSAYAAVRFPPRVHWHSVNSLLASKHWGHSFAKIHEPILYFSLYFKTNTQKNHDLLDCGRIHAGRFGSNFFLPA